MFTRHRHSFESSRTIRIRARLQTRRYSRKKDGGLQPLHIWQSRARRADPANITAGVRTFFVTSSISGKRNLLQSHRSAQLFIDVLYNYRAQHKYLLHDFVVMPDHFHVLMTIGQEISIERAVQFIKGGFAFRVGKELGFRAPVWERGFSEVRVYDSEVLSRIREYIAQNPVRRRLAGSPSEYAYSSSHGGFELDEIPQGLKPAANGFLVGTSEDVS